MDSQPPPINQTSKSTLRRHITSLFTSLSFAFSLRLANMTSPYRVLGFLIFPPHPAFDTSLVALALGALPLATLLYQIHGKNLTRKPITPPKVDWRLVTGAMVFGIGWGIEGVCRKSLLPYTGTVSGTVHLSQEERTHTNVNTISSFSR